MLTRLFPSKAFPAFGTFCMERAKALAEHADVRVMVPTPYYPSWLPGKEDWKKWLQVEREAVFAHGIRVTYPRYFSPPGTATWLQGVTMARSAKRELAERHDGWVPDVIDGHFAFPDGYTAMQLGHAIGVPTVVTCHGSDLRQYPKIPLVGNMLRKTMGTVNRVVSVSSDLLRQSIQLGCQPERAVLLSNGVDPAKFALRPKVECRTRLGLPQERKIGVYVGYLIDLKDQSLVLRALAAIRQQGMQPPLVVLVGDGPNRQRLEEEVQAMRLEKDVVFAGSCKHDEVAYWLGAADWLLLSSRAEGWPTVYFEAMACGRPVITSNVSAAKDAINSPEYGMIVEPRTDVAFAAAMIEATNRDFDASIIRAYAESNSWSLWATRAMQIFEEVARERLASG